jgi:hypothetical protein
MRHGFRLFQASLRLRDGQKPIAFRVDVPDVPGKSSWEFVDYLFQLMSSYKDVRVQGRPHTPVDLTAIEDEDERDVAEAQERLRAERRLQEPIFYVEAVERIGRHIGFTVRYGAPRGHDKATSLDGPHGDKDINGLPPTRTYRCYFIAPDSSSSDDVGILAVEAIGQACPWRFVQAWQRHWASMVTATDDDPAPAWWKLRLQPLSDDSTLQSLITRGVPRSAKLRRYQMTANGTVKTADMKLEMDIDFVTADRKARKEVKRWRKKAKKGESVAVADAADRISGILGPEIEALNFNDVEIVFEDAEYGTHSLGPDDMEEAFVYEVSDAMSPDADTLKAKIRSAIKRVPMERKPAFDWTGWPAARR